MKKCTSCKFFLITLIVLVAAGALFYLGQNEGLLGKLAIKSRTQTSREVKMGYNFTGKYVAQLDNGAEVLYDLVQTDVKGSFPDIKGTSQYQDMKGTADGQGYQSGGQEKTTLIGTYKSFNTDIVYKNYCSFLISDLKVDPATGMVTEFSGKCDLRENDQVITTMGIKGLKADKNIPAYNFVDFTGSYTGIVEGNEYSLELWQPTPGVEEVTKMPVPLAAISFGGSTEGVGGGLMIKDQVSTWPIVVKYGSQFLIKYTVSKWEKNDYGNVISFSGDFLKQETNGTNSTGIFVYRSLVHRVNYSAIVDAKKTAAFGAILGALTKLQQAYSSADPRQTIADFVAGKLGLSETPKSPADWQALISTQISTVKQEVRQEVEDLARQLAGYTGLFIDGLIKFLEKPVNFSGNYIDNIEKLGGPITLALYQGRGVANNRIAGVSFKGLTPGIVIGGYNKDEGKLQVIAQYKKTGEELSFMGNVSATDDERTRNVHSFEGTYEYLKDGKKVSTGDFEFVDLLRGATLVENGVDNAKAIRAKISKALQGIDGTTLMAYLSTAFDGSRVTAIAGAISTVQSKLPDGSTIGDLRAALSDKRDLPQGKEAWVNAIRTALGGSTTVVSPALDFGEGVVIEGAIAELAGRLEDRGYPIIDTLLDFIYEWNDNKMLNFTGSYVGQVTPSTHVVGRVPLLTFELWQGLDGKIVGKSAYGKAETQDGGFSYSFGDVVIKGTTCEPNEQSSDFTVIYNEAIKMNYSIDCPPLDVINSHEVLSFGGKYKKYNCEAPNAEMTKCTEWDETPTEGTFAVEGMAASAWDHFVNRLETLAGRLGNAAEALSEVDLQEWIESLRAAQRIKTIDWQAMIDDYLREYPQPVDPSPLK